MSPANPPHVDVIVCTYNRPAECIKTLTGLMDNLAYSGPLNFYLADDASSTATLKKIRASTVFKELNPEILSTDQNSGWAANNNNALGKTKSPYIFFTEDDYVLDSPLDLSLGVAIMQAQPDLGMLRYRGTAGDPMIYHQFEADISAQYDNPFADFPGEEEAYREGFGVPGKVTYLQMDSGAAGLWIYSNGPHLKRRSFHEFYGLYPLGLKMGETEEAYAHTVKDGMKQPGAPAIAILPDWVSMRFDHIGKSYQHTAEDK